MSSNTQEIKYGVRDCTQGWVMFTRMDLIALLREMDDFMDTHYDGERRHSDTVSVNLEVANYTERKGLHMRDKIRSRVWKNPPETADIRNITSEEFNAWKCRPEDRKTTLEEHMKHMTIMRQRRLDRSD